MGKKDLILGVFTLGVIGAFVLIRKLKGNSITHDEYTFEDAVNYFKKSEKPEGATSASLIKETHKSYIKITLVFMNDDGNVLSGQSFKVNRLGPTLSEKLSDKDVLIFT